jgi:arsenate reductase
MQNIIIWHNQKCSKSRAALAYLEKKEIIPTILKYMENTPTQSEIKNVLKFLDIKASKLLRIKEDIYLKLNLKDEMNEDKLVKIMFENPELIERPIIINGEKAVIARPLENIDKIV